MQSFSDIAIFSGNAHQELASAVCKHLEMPLGESEVFQFSNEEVFVRILDNIREKDVFLIQPIVSPVNTRLMELLIMIDAAKRASAGRITAVVPYYAYGRSDKKDQPRVPISGRLVANFLEVAGADRVLTLDLHAGQIQGFFNIPVDELTAFPMLSDYFRGLNLEKPIVVATDVGGAKRARDVAERLGCDLAIIDKRRTGNDEQAEALSLIGEVENHDCIIVDDEILTGGTVASAVDLMRGRGARSVYVACVHPVFSNKAFDVLDNTNIDQLIFTDSLPLVFGSFNNVNTSKLSIASLLGDAIHRIHTGGSVGALFR
ncbi:MAG: ribose-phosphate pyrophosphokinase [Chloroflexi bacterium]|nr:ribose-phosphate pyrophosphokinase [Chloroflexota bacterium]|tara:strand:+ start:701 stop:1651 length:951 start_codon:yes stop_codon:yes gene_type:complete